MDQDRKKRLAAKAAIAHVERGSVIGVGTGSTTNHFIDALGELGGWVDGAVASSVVSAERLRKVRIPVLELDEVGALPLYVDGADEATREGFLVKGGGGALTREKIVAAASDRFVCIVDDSKLVARLGAFPVPIEIIRMARRYVADAVAALGGRAVLRAGFTTDNGNPILDVHDLPLDDPRATESSLDRIAGVVSNGLFCHRGADLLLVGGERGVEEI